MKLGKEVKIGIVSIVAIGLVVWGVNYLKGNDLFQNEIEYYAKYKKIDGLNSSSAVQVNGYIIGQVREIKYDIKNKKTPITVKFAVNKEYMLTYNTKAIITSIDLMGTKAIDLEMYDTSVFHAPLDTIRSQSEEGIIEQVSETMLPLKIAAEDLIKDIRSTINIINALFTKETSKDLQLGLSGIKNTFVELENVVGGINTLLVKESPNIESIIENVESLASNLEQNNKQFDNIIKNFSNISDSLAQSNILEMLTSAQTTLNDLNLIVEKINSNTGTAGMLINNDSLYNNLEEASKNLNLLINDVKQNPKKYLHFSLFDFGKTETIIQN